MAKRIDSPCVSICQLKGGLCVGCGRTTEEITRWQSMKRPERLQTNRLAAQRLKKLSKD
ncbi:DUF1289 domain-containing protein [Halomonas organivorans]|uniref:Putative Fe-S protein YdhL (DUF1289 family) n=1 Tax=Halomonas organivorans TaxID=257772 RepID=A0A7W5G6D7_9GAMM|nr:DUF1289 domain-containing protein [Halomonas organivorans]MBB3142428.1 putative Fe-S protein YdhL (DUF1289 family) [Halomonas organivorans]